MLYKISRGFADARGQKNGKKQRRQYCCKRISMQSSGDNDSEGADSVDNYRPRRAHKKSRNGCADCKRRRIKCDEGRPRCRRCTRLDQPCIYPAAALSPTSAGFHSGGHSPGTEASLSVSSSNPHAIDFRSASPGSSSSSTRPTSALGLNAEDSDLFAHFLQHTAHVCGMEPESQYAWRLGVPKLALKSPTLMHSVLAAAAVCLCNDIMSAGGYPEPHTASKNDIERVTHLMAVAAVHHEQSVREVGAAIAEPSRSLDLDVVLSNAATMVPYGFMLRRVQGWMARVVSDSSELTYNRQAASITSNNVSVTWISLCRMVKTAVWGLRDVEDTSTKPRQELGLPEPLLEYFDSRPSLSPTAHILYPVVSATATAAVAKLPARILALIGTLDSPSTAACMEAFEVLQSTAADVAAAANITNPECTEACSDNAPQGHLAHASPWVLAWLIQHAHLLSTPHRGLTRLILSFLNRVSEEYLDLLKPVLDAIPTADLYDLSAMTSSTQSQYINIGIAMSMEQLVAAEIFAHWLVLLMLLETNWWIGDIGLQELARIVGAIQGQYSSSLFLFAQESGSDLMHMGSPEAGDGWWPERMRRVAVELRQQAHVRNE